MNASIHRAALAVAALAVSATVAGAFVTDGYLTAQRAAAAANAALASQVVYVTPSQSTAQAQVVHVVVPSTGDEENEGPGGNQ